MEGERFGDGLVGLLSKGFLFTVALTWWVWEVSEDGIGKLWETGNIFCMLNYT